jgi:hypothetical protein
MPAGCGGIFTLWRDRVLMAAGDQSFRTRGSLPKSLREKPILTFGKSQSA